MLNGEFFNRIFRIKKYYQMYALIAMASALTLLVVLLRLKVKLGLSMVLSSVALAILLGVAPGEF